MENLLPLFAECDSINYLRYGSLYLELMNCLPIEHPHIYEEFMQGHFMVKTSPDNFNAVAADMKLDQKCSSGIISQTRQIEFVSEWEVVYHEVLAITNTFRNLTKSKTGEHEYELHHELSGN